MNNKTKYFLIGGSILILGLAGYLFLKKKGEPKPPTNTSGNQTGADVVEPTFDEIEEICRYSDEGNPQYEKYCN